MFFRRIFVALGLEHLQRIRLRTLGQAPRIPGVTPAAVSLINVFIEIQGKRLVAAE